MIKVFPNVINFVFVSKVRKRIGFSKTSFYWTSKGARKRCFTEETHVNDMFSLIYKCFMVIVFKQDIGIPMGNDPAPFRAIYSFLCLN